MYRPPNWDVVKPIPYEPKDGESAWGFYEHGVEAGADAMLESLRKQAREQGISMSNGTLIFIPDEED